MSAQAPHGRSRLYTAPFIALCVTAFVAFSSQTMIQPILALAVIELGGDAAVAGAVIIAFSVPSVLVRPLFGRWADAWSRRGVLAVGMAGVLLSGLLYLVPSLAVMFLTRIGHGLAWAAYNTGAGSMLASFAGPDRRGEAAGIYSLMHGLANVLMPAAGLVLVGVWGIQAPFLMVAVFGMLGLLGVALVRSPVERPTPPAPRAPRREPLLERSALLPMAIDLLWSMAYPLFFVFVPVIATERGIPLDALSVYFLTAGGTLVIGRLVASRLLDRFSRGTAIALGGGLGLAGLTLGMLPGDILTLTLAGSLYAVGMSAVAPSTMALTMDRAPASRIGAAMATHSAGGQMGIGIGALITGIAFESLGELAPFLLACATTGLMLVLVASRSQVLRQPPVRFVAG